MSIRLLPVKFKNTRVCDVCGLEADVTHPLKVTFQGVNASDVVELKPAGDYCIYHKMLLQYSWKDILKSFPEFSNHSNSRIIEAEKEMIDSMETRMLLEGILK